MIRFYLETLLTEKGISLNHTFEVKSDSIFGNNYVPMEVVIEFIENLSPSIQEQIKKTLIQIDFKNGNVLHFLEYITKGMVELQNTEN
jgi:hypothetical protein